MIIRDTDTKTLEAAREILQHHHDGLGYNAKTEQALRIKIKAIDITLAERQEGTA